MRTIWLARIRWPGDPKNKSRLPERGDSVFVLANMVTYFELGDPCGTVLHLVGGEALHVHDAIEDVKLRLD